MHSDIDQVIQRHTVTVGKIMEYREKFKDLKHRTGNIVLHGVLKPNENHHSQENHCENTPN